VTYKTWRDIWLSEGWASYVEALWLEHKNGFASYKTQMATFKSSSSDSRPVVDANADDFGLGVTYYKSAWVLHMLRHVVGDANFFQATKDYLADGNLRYKTVVSTDFQNYQEAQYTQDLDWFFDEWLTRSSRPAYSWSWSSHQVGPDWYVDLDITQTQADAVYTMPIDFGVTLASSATTTVKVFNDQRTQSFSVLVGASAPSTVAFDPDAWILANSSEATATVPSPPTLLSVVGNGATGVATVKWAASPTAGVTAYRLYSSADGQTGWTLLQDNISAAATTTNAAGLVPGQSMYFRMTAVITAASIPTDVYGLRLGTGTSQVLVVDGYDRWSTQAFSGGANHDFAADHGRGIAAHGNSFDTCANEAVGAGVTLGGHNAVIYVLGDESTVDETFSLSEQTLVSAYLVAGGDLFVTGNEIGWDLGRTSRPAADQAFYLDYLKAAYVADDSFDYSVSGTGGVSAFGAHSFTYGDGGDAPYLPGTPDLIATAGGSTAALEYSVGNVAGVQYKGFFGTGIVPGALVHLGFSFETVYPESSRLQMMSDVLDYFDLGGAAGVRDWTMLD
ncbi:MAG: M1 family aminopeptidase, partial [Candidatus Sumerlaeota bacterium]